MYAYIKHAFVSPLLHVPVCVSFLALNFGTRLHVSHSSAISLANPLKRPPLLSPIMSFHPGIMSQCLSHLLCMFAACWDTLLITTEKPQYNLKLVNDNLSLHCLISNNLLMQYFRYTFQGLISSLRYTFISFLITCPGPAVIRKSAPIPQQQASCQKVLELHSFKQKTGTFVQM